MHLDVLKLIRTVLLPPMLYLASCSEVATTPDVNDEAAEGEVIVYSNEFLTVRVDSARYEDSAQDLTLSVSGELRKSIELPSDRMLASSYFDELAKGRFSYISQLLKINCEDQVVSDFRMAALGMDWQSAGDLGYVASHGALVKPLDQLPSEILHEVVFELCIMFWDDHPFRLQDGWRLIHRSDTDRFEMHDNFDASEWPNVRVDVVRTSIKVNEDAYHSVRWTESIDCLNNVSTILELRGFSRPFEQGDTVFEHDLRDRPQLLKQLMLVQDSAGVEIVKIACSRGRVTRSH